MAGGAGVSAVRLAAIERLVPRALQRVRAPFVGAPSRPFDVVVHASLDGLPDGLRGELHPGTPGFALLGRDQIHLVLDEVQLRPPHDLTTVLAHELVHVLIDQYAGEFAPTVPRWVHEGLAQHLSGGTYLGTREEDLLYPAAVGRLPRFRELVRRFPDDEGARRVAYAQSVSFVAFLARKVGIEVVVEAIHRSTELDGYVGGFALRAGTPLGWFEDEWILWVRDESGARWRFFFQNCFSYSMIGGLVLLALALGRRLERDERARRKLEREERDMARAGTEDAEP
ncbi:MAG: hypothetical protein ACO3UM_04290 [Planctomycetota bacterium]